MSVIDVYMSKVTVKQQSGTFPTGYSSGFPKSEEVKLEEKLTEQETRVKLSTNFVSILLNNYGKPQQKNLEGFNEFFSYIDLQNLAMCT